MIRVLHILSTVTGGGVERRRMFLSKYLDSNFFEQKLIGTHKAGFVAEQIEANGVEILEIGDFHGPFHWAKHRKVQKIIQEFEPHIIHGAVYEGVTLAAINGLLKQVSIIILEETSDPQNRSKKASFLLKLFSLLADRFIAISDNVATYLKEVVKVRPTKIKLITNGVELPREVLAKEVEDLKKLHQIADDDIVVGTVGRLFNDHKRITDLIKAFTFLHHANVKLVVVGGGPDEHMLKEYAVQLGVQDKVIFVGYQFDTAPYFKLMDIFCIASSREGFGLVAAEAMLHQLPVIATRVGGLQDIVVDGETGFLVPAFSSEAVSEKIQFLLHHPQERKNMGEKGYQRAMKNYTAERYCKEVEALYLKLIQEKGIKI
jgi:L-malate glycosyltransferase